MIYPTLFFYPFLILFCKCWHSQDTHLGVNWKCSLQVLVCVYVCVCGQPDAIPRRQCVPTHHWRRCVTCWLNTATVCVFACLCWRCTHTGDNMAVRFQDQVSLGHGECFSYASLWASCVTRLPGNWRLCCFCSRRLRVKVIGMLLLCKVWPGECVYNLKNRFGVFMQPTGIEALEVSCMVFKAFLKSLVKIYI